MAAVVGYYLNFLKCFVLFALRGGMSLTLWWSILLAIISGGALIPLGWMAKTKSAVSWSHPQGSEANVEKTRSLFNLGRVGRLVI